MYKELHNNNIKGESGKKDILRRRAKSLAESLDKSDKFLGKGIDCLAFFIAQEEYAINSEYIKEVIYIKDITPLPCTPDFVKGIINVRGNIISVIDIRSFFGLPDKGISNLNRVIVLEHEDIEFGILTDEICGNILINIDSLQSEISAITDVPKNFIMGIWDNNLIVLDIMKLLSNDRIIINEQV